jgi:glycosyltransferase involved in cell wall biosynthesis
MRIAMIIEAWEPIWGGGQAHVLELSKKLAGKHGCEIDIFTMNLKGADEKNETHTNEKIHVLRTGKQRDFFSFSDRIFWIPEIITTIKKAHRKKKYDIIHAHANLPGIPGKILSKSLHIPIVYTVHGSNFLDFGKKNIFFFVEKFLFTKMRYDSEISVSKNFLRYANINVPIVIPNGVDIDRFSAARNRYSKKRSADGVRILFVGRLDRIKGIDILIEVVRQLQQKLRKARVTVRLVGYGYDETRLENIAHNSGIDDIVTFVGKLSGEPLLKAYAISDIFILPSRSEGFPLTILEAFASKIPIIATDVGENASIIDDGRNGFVIPAEDPAALAETIEHVTRMKGSTLERMGMDGYNKIHERFSWDAVAKTTYEIYTKLI